jgi:2-hydroxychromene-2-carboxylate isomerase
MEAGMVEVDFYFDVVCPYAYLAHTQVEELCERSGAELNWFPILLGGLFRSIGAGDGPMATQSAQKAKLNALDMFRWAEIWDVPLTLPSGHPNRTVLAMRCVIASDDPPRAAKALFRRYWRDGLDLSEQETVRDTLDAAGFDGAALIEAAGDPAIKAQLRSNTDKAAEIGVFGVPTFVIHAGGEPALVWGQDRLHFVEAAINGKLRA